MAYREVSMEEIREVLRLWLAGRGIQPIAVQVGLDRKTVRRYAAAARACGVERGAASVTEEQWTAIAAALQPERESTHGETWRLCVEHQTRIEQQLATPLKLTRIQALLRRDGIELPYSTLHRFAVRTLGFGRRAPTIAVLDGEPGHELQVDTGWMTYLEPDGTGPRRRFRAWIFTPSFSRYRFVYPCLRETTDSAIEACEAAWRFYGGVFRVLIPDRTKAIVETSDALQPRLVRGFLEYSQARGFEVDPTRPRSPQDKPRVERSVSYARDACFAGERLRSIEQARERALVWCEFEAGMRIHSRTQRRPRELFLEQEQARLLPAPSEVYDVPIHVDPKVARDQYAQVAKALYSLPTEFVGKVLHARADRHTVRFYDGCRLVKMHPRMAPGKRSTDPADFPADKSIYAHRDTATLVRRADDHGPAIGTMARHLLDVPLPWTRMRRVYALLGLVKKYGPARVESACATALAAEMYEIHRLTRMLADPRPPESPATAAPSVIPLARYLRPATQYALPLAAQESRSDEH